MAQRSRQAIVVEDLRPVEAGYLSLQSLAVYSGLSVRTLRTLLVDPVDPLPRFKLPGKILVKKSDFDAWMSRYQVQADETTTISAIVDDVVAGLR